MSIAGGLENVLIKLGKNNKPTLVAMGVASAKGICRPIFTMADKKQDKETKKYTAFREGLTEAIAIPIYWGSGKLAEGLAKTISKPKGMTKKTYKDTLKQIKQTGEQLTPEMNAIRKTLFKTTTTLSMFGVFLSALLVIPAVCSATIKPLMQLVQPKKKQEPINIKENMPVVARTYSSHMFKQPKFQSLNSFGKTYNPGMKVGSV